MSGTADSPIQRQSSEENRWWEIHLLISSLAAALLFGAAAYNEVAMAPWRVYQREYRTALIANATDERTRRAAESFQIRYYQSYLPGLGRVDRCITCHVGIDNPTMQDAPQPLTTHPGDILANHPVDRFGCTICHGGRGRATSAREAHGEEPDRPAPMRRGEMLQVSCAQCHSDPELPGMPIYNLARKLFTEKACQACHALRGTPPTLPAIAAMHGPDLTKEADKHDFQWHVDHFLDPAKVVPGSKMPNFELDQEGAEALAFLMMSFDGESPAHGYIPLPDDIATDGQPLLTADQLGVDIDPQAAPGYVGSETCLRCHGTLHASLHETWQNSKMGKDAYPAVRDVVDNNVCLPCHTTGYNSETNVFVEPNVGCEACHGPGREYVPYILAGNSAEHKARALGNALQQDRCVDCHRAPHVAGEKHEQAMRRLAEMPPNETETGQQTGDRNALSDLLTSFGRQQPHLRLVSQLATESNTHVPPPAAPNEFGVVVDPRAAPGHVGSESCLFCHATIHADVAHQWRHSKKAHTFEAIRDMPDHELCLPCHTTGYNPATKVFVERSVGCEACHGPGEDYTIDVVEGRKAEHAQRAGVRGQYKNSCVSCHHVHVPREKHVETIRAGQRE